MRIHKTEQFDLAGVALRLLRPAALACLAMAPAACGKNAEKCDQALNTTRQAVQAENLELARQWRDYAYNRCDDQNALQSLDQQLIGKQNEIAQRQADEQRKKTETEQLINTYAQFIGEKRNQVQAVAGNVQCQPGDGQAKAHGWCTASRAVGEKYAIKVRYWDPEKQAFLFVTQPENPVTCAELGEHNVVRSWQVPATDDRTAARTHCEFTKGPLAGLHGLVSQASNAEVYVFSPKYLEHDPAMRQKVQGG